jgi:hypothetical protein
VTTEVRSAGRCRLAKVRGARRCMTMDLSHLYHLPPDGRATSVVVSIGRYLRIFGPSFYTPGRFSTPRVAVRRVCHTWRVLGKRAPKLVAEIYPSQAINSRENRVSLFTLSSLQIYRFYHSAIGGARRPESGIASIFRRFLGIFRQVFSESVGVPPRSIFSTRLELRGPLL